MNRTGHVSLSLFAFSLVLMVKNVALVSYLFVLLGAFLPDFDLGIKGLHRKLFHNVWFAGIVGLLIADNVGFMPAQLFLIGFITHVLGDSLTPEGIHLFWPGKTRIRIGGLKTGSMTEYVITLFMFFLGFTILLHYFSFEWTKAVYASGLLLFGLIVVWLRPP